MTEPRSSPSNPDPVEVERRKQEEEDASPEAVSTLAGGTPVRARPAEPHAEGVPPDPVRDDEIVEPAAVQPGGISLATIVTVAIAIILILVLLFWIF